MTPPLERVLKMYARGTLATIPFVTELVLETVVPPTAEWVARLPAEAVGRIRVLVSAPKTEWKVEQLERLRRDPEPDDQTELALWRTGLALWRAYFAIAE